MGTKNGRIYKGYERVGQLFGGGREIRANSGLLPGALRPWLDVASEICRLFESLSSIRRENIRQKVIAWREKGRILPAPPEDKAGGMLILEALWGKHSGAKRRRGIDLQ